MTLGKPLSELSISSENKAQRPISEPAAKSPSDIIFVRSRMLYARAALNARGLVHFGLRHIRMWRPISASIPTAKDFRCLEPIAAPSS